MINKDEITQLSNCNLRMLKEALRQTELRVSYTIDTKKRLDTKALTLLSIFISFATLFASITTSVLTKNEASNQLIIPFILSSFAFVTGSVYLLKALKSQESATLGRYPDTWLYDSKKIAGDCEETKRLDNEGYIITHILLDYQKSIKICDASNDTRVDLIDTAIKWGISSPILLLVSSIILVVTNHLYLF